MELADADLVKVNIKRAEYPNAVVIEIAISGADTDTRTLVGEAVMMAVNGCLKK